MSRTLTIEPEAEAEIAAATAWYHEKNPSIRNAFIDALGKALGRIQEHPEQYGGGASNPSDHG